MMTHVADPRNAPEMLLLRESMRAWRFYDQFRTDVDAPAIAADRDVYSYPGKRWS
jgi:predicted ATPase